MTHPSITTCIIAKNEAANIADCIRSAKPFSDEVLVIDNGSEDDTVAICEGLGCRVIVVPQGSESELRNTYIDHARTPWLFVIDADERVEARDIEHLTQVDEDVDIYRLPINNYYGGGKWGTFIVGRLFQRADARYQGEMHCSLSFSGQFRFGFMPVTIHHLDALLRERARGKREKYSQNLREQIANPAYAAQHLRLLNFLGVEHMASGRYAEAERCFLEVAQSDSFYRHLARLYLAQACALQRRYDEALAALAEMIYLPADTTDAPLLIGEATDPALTEDLLQRCCVVLAECNCAVQNYAAARYWTQRAQAIWPFASQHDLNAAAIARAQGEDDDVAALAAAFAKNSMLMDARIYQPQDAHNIYAFQTSLLSGSAELLESMRRGIASAQR